MLRSSNLSQMNHSQILRPCAGEIWSNFETFIMGIVLRRYLRLKNAIRFISENGFVQLFPEVSEVRMKAFKNMKNFGIVAFKTGITFN